MASIPLHKAAGQSKENVKEHFERLATTWHDETDYLSSMSESNRHPAY